MNLYIRVRFVVCIKGKGLKNSPDMKREEKTTSSKTAQKCSDVKINMTGSQGRVPLTGWPLCTCYA